MKKIGLALGSGAARGWSHIGVLEALLEAGLKPSYIAGTSMGSIVGGAYAAGQLASLKEAGLSLDLMRIIYYSFEMNMPRSGLIDGKKIVEFLSPHIGDGLIEDLAVPFQCVATDVLSGEPVIIKEGKLLDAVRASISIPGIFTPIYRNERTLVDGGLVNPVPVDVVRNMGAEIVIAVDINHGRLGKAERSIPKNYVEKLRHATEEAMRKDKFGLMEKLHEKIAAIDPTHLGPIRHWLAPDPMPNVFDVLGNSIRIMEAQIAEARFAIHVPDVLIRPEVGHIAVMDFHRAAEVMEAGYEAAKRAVAEIMKQCN